MILDTNALSAVADDDAGIRDILAASNSLELPVIVLGEYRYGILRSRNRARYSRWLDGLIADLGILDISEDTTHHYADINLELRAVGTPIPTNDLWIAALCRQHQLSILSRDRHFDSVKGPTGSCGKFTSYRNPVGAAQSLGGLLWKTPALPRWSGKLSCSFPVNSGQLLAAGC